MKRREFISSGIVAAGSAAFGSITRSLLGGREREAGKSLPFDSEVEWLESTGTQYIDTGCNSDGSLFWDIIMQPTQNSLQRIGAIVTSPSILRQHLSCPESGTWTWRLGYYDNVVGGGQGSLQRVPHRFQLFCRGMNVVTAFDGEEISVSQYSAFNLRQNFYIFGRNNQGKAEPSKVRMHYAAFYQWDVPMRILRPVRFTNEYGESEGGMYDEVTGEVLRNNGTGMFVIGPDV